MTDSTRHSLQPFEFSQTVCFKFASLTLFNYRLRLTGLTYCLTNCKKPPPKKQFSVPKSDFDSPLSKYTTKSVEFTIGCRPAVRFPVSEILSEIMHLQPSKTNSGINYVIESSNWTKVTYH